MNWLIGEYMNWQVAKLETWDMHAKKYEGFTVIVVWTRAIGRALRNLINASGSEVFSCQFDF